MDNYIVLTRFPRMEQSRRWNQMCVPLAEGWHDAWIELLKVTTVAPVGSAARKDRWTKAGKTGKSFLKAKECPPGVAPYLLGYGMRRCKADVDATNKWSHVVHDVDAAPLALRELFHVVARAFGDLRHVLWTTWSSRDGYASARIMLPLSRTCTAEEAAALWWLTRRWLVEAGLPEESAKAGEPCDDSRAMDGRLFYLPSVPEGMVPGTEGWGGVKPIGSVSTDDTPLLDADALLAEARQVRAEDEPEHLLRFPDVPVPGGKKGRGGARVAASRGPAGSGSGSEVVHEDWAAVPFAGTTLLAWCDAHLAPGTEASVGSPWRDDGGSGESGKSLRVHRGLDGKLWGKDFVTGKVHVNGEGPSVRARTLATADPLDLGAFFRLARIEEEAANRPIREVRGLSFEDLSESSEGEDTLSSELSDNRLSRAGERLDVLGRVEVNCPKARTHLVGKGNTISARLLPCGARTCPACGPVIRRAEAAAAAAHLGDLAAAGWTFRLLGRAMDGAEEKDVRRWRQGRDDRGLLVVPSNLGSEATTILLAAPGEEIPDLDDAEELAAADVADEVEGLILGQTWGRAGTHGLRGDRALVKAICLLRNALLGRQRAKEALDGTGSAEDADAVVVTTTATLDEVREAVEAELGAPLRGGIRRFRLGALATWSAPEGVDLAAVLGRAAQSGALGRVLGRVPLAPLVELLPVGLTPEGEAALVAELSAA